MIRLGFAPRAKDFNNSSSMPNVDAWLTQVAARFNIIPRSGAPNVSEVPVGQWGIYKDTASGNMTLYINDNGTLKTISGGGGGGSSITTPAFSAYMSVTQTMPAATATKINLDTVEFDTTGAFDTSVHRYTPKVAGYYQVTGAVSTTAHFNTNNYVAIFKNGSQYKIGNQIDSTVPYTVSVAGLVYMNGTTDYIELWAYNALSIPANTPSNTFFQGILVQTGILPMTTVGVTPDSIPTSPASADDEFEGASLDTAGTRRSGAIAWAWRNQGTTTATLSQGSLILNLPTNGGADSLRMVEQTLPGSGTWKYRAKIGVHFSSDSQNAGVGMGIITDSTGKGVWIQKYMAPTNVKGWAVTKMNSVSSTNSNYFNDTSGVPNLIGAPATQWHYFEIEWDGTNYKCRASAFGIDGTFHDLASFTPADFVGTATKIGIIGNPYGEQVTLVCDWFRRIS